VRRACAELGRAQLHADVQNTCAAWSTASSATSTATRQPDPLSPADSAPLYVEMMGGSAKIVARRSWRQGKYLHASEILNRWCRRARNARRASCWPTSTNSWLQAESTSGATLPAGAFELRTACRRHAADHRSGRRPRMRRQWLDFSASASIRESRGPALHVTGDARNGEKYAVELSNRPSPTSRLPGARPDLTLTLNRAISTVMMAWRA